MYGDLYCVISTSRSLSPSTSPEVEAIGIISGSIIDLIILGFLSNVIFPSPSYKRGNISRPKHKISSSPSLLKSPKIALVSRFLGNSLIRFIGFSNLPFLLTYILFALIIRSSDNSSSFKSTNAIGIPGP